jgi:pimeloyl-ACP methyl ester carboxylesterase
MSRGVLGLAAVLAAVVFLAVFFGLASVQMSPTAGTSVHVRAFSRPDMMGVLRDEHDLFEDVTKDQAAGHSSSDQAALLAPEQWAPRPGSFEPPPPEVAELEAAEPAEQAEPAAPEQKADRPATPAAGVQVYLLLGGLLGTDGTVTSAGMFHLAAMLRELPDTTVTTYNWSSWPDAYRAILANQGKAKIVVIGYSGGGSRATWLAAMPTKPQIDLMVSYDPSPRWQMKPIGANVKKALCYHNTQPMMYMPGIGSLGGGELVSRTPGRGGDAAASPAIENLDIAEQHFLVQVDQSLHQRTFEAVRALASPPAASAVPNLNAGQVKPVAHDRTTALMAPADRVHLSLADQH